jgi:hypothetical protein
MRIGSINTSRFSAATLAGALIAAALVIVPTLGSIFSGGVPTGAGPEAGAPTLVDKGVVSGGVTPAPGAALDGAKTDPSVVRTAYMQVEIGDVDVARTHLEDRVKAAGGYASSSTRYGDASAPILEITFRAPATALDDLLAAFRSEGKLLSESINSYEVTMQLVDLEARLKSLRASESAYLDLMKRASSVADVLAVQTELTRVRADIESYDAQRAALADQVAMATITVQLSTPASPVTAATKDFDLGREIGVAVANLIAVGRGAIVLALNAVVVLLPIVVVGALVGGLVGRAIGPIAGFAGNALGVTGRRRPSRRR